MTCGEAAGESLIGSGGASGSANDGVGGVMPERSIRGLDGAREPALGRDDGADDAALPGRLGFTNVASGASSESDDEDELEVDDDDDDLVYKDRTFCEGCLALTGEGADGESRGVSNTCRR